MKKLLIVGTLALLGALATLPARAFDPITSAISKGVATAMDVRSKDDVKVDVEIDAAVTKKLVEHKGDDFKNVSLLVFARHGVLVGFAKNEEAKRLAEDQAKDKRLRSLKNGIVVGAAGGGFAGNAVLDKKIDLTLTATKGVSSVNMRWKVYGGDVFLAGVAQSKAEADLAVRKIKGLDGVKTVHSSLRIGKK
jgi:osmotically-inducible protein OsmY